MSVRVGAHAPVQPSQVHSENEAANTPIKSDNSARGALADITHVANPKNLDPREATVEGIKHQTLDANGHGHVERGELHGVQLIHGESGSVEQLKSHLDNFLKSYSSDTPDTNARNAQLIDIVEQLVGLSPAATRELKQDPAFQEFLERADTIPYEKGDMALGLAITLLSAKMTDGVLKEDLKSAIADFLNEFIDGIHGYRETEKVPEAKNVSEVLHLMSKNPVLMESAFIPGLHDVLEGSEKSLKEQFLPDLQLELTVSRPPTPLIEERPMASGISLVATVSGAILHRPSGDAASQLKRSASFDGTSGNGKTARTPHPKSASAPVLGSVPKDTVKADKTAAKIFTESGREVLQVGQGAVKAIHLILDGSEEAKRFVLITALDVTGLAKIFAPNQKKAELSKEVTTAIAIRTNLLNDKISHLLGGKTGIEPATPSLITKALVDNYKTVDELELYLGQIVREEAISEPWLDISKEQARAVLGILQDPANSVQVGRLKETGENLALHLEAVGPEYQIKGKTAIRMQRAGLSTGEIDLEDLTRKNKDLSLHDRMDLMLQVFKGMRDLHEAGFSHDDLKPENILVFQEPNGKIRVRIADWGKADPLGENEVITHYGNHRFMGPEKSRSRKNEVYSSALIGIRIIEGMFLTDEVRTLGTTSSELTEKEQNLMKKDKKKVRLGIERELCQSDQCPQQNLDTTFRKLAVYAPKVLGPAPKHPDEKSKSFVEGSERPVVLNYINQLVLKLQEKYPEDQMMINNLKSVLIRMTESNPKNRPSMEEIVTELEALQTALKAVS